MSKHLPLEEGKRLLEEYGLHQVVITGAFGALRDEED